jgi:hypothetical protein
MIVQQKSNQTSLVTICKYEVYQGGDSSESIPGDTADDTPSDTADGHQTGHKQECNKNKNVKNSNTLPATPKGDSVNYDKFPDQPDPAILKDWLSARRKAKAAHTQTAMDRIGGELHKAKAMGFAVDDCLAEAATRTWRGFKAEWMKNAGHNTGYQSNAVAVSDPDDTSWAEGFDPRAGDFENL